MIVLADGNKEAVVLRSMGTPVGRASADTTSWSARDLIALSLALARNVSPWLRLAALASTVLDGHSRTSDHSVRRLADALSDAGGVRSPRKRALIRKGLGRVVRKSVNGSVLERRMRDVSPTAAQSAAANRVGGTLTYGELRALGALTSTDQLCPIPTLMWKLHWWTPQHLYTGDSSVFVNVGKGAAGKQAARAAQPAYEARKAAARAAGQQAPAPPANAPSAVGVPGARRSTPLSVNAQPAVAAVIASGSSLTPATVTPAAPAPAPTQTSSELPPPEMEEPANYEPWPEQAPTGPDFSWTEEPQSAGQPQIIVPPVVQPPGGVITPGSYNTSWVEEESGGYSPFEEPFSYPIDPENALWSPFGGEDIGPWYDEVRATASPAALAALEYVGSVDELSENDAIVRVYDAQDEAAPRGNMCAHCGKALVRLGDFTGRIKPGEFFRSEHLVARVADEGLGYFGEIDIGSDPMRITIGNDIGEARGKIALSHELVHMLNRMLKLPLSHEQVHNMGVSLVREYLPVMRALDKHFSKGA